MMNIGLFDTVLVANRGEIAVRVMRTLKAMGIRAVAVYSDADAEARHVAEADIAVRIGPPPALQSYLDVDAVVGAAVRTGAQAGTRATDSCRRTPLSPPHCVTPEWCSSARRRQPSQ